VAKLAFEGRDRPVSLEARKSQEWLNRAHATIKHLQSWNQEDDDSAADFFHQKCDIYEMLIALLPPTPERVSLVDQYMDFLSRASIQRDSPAEWYMQVRFVLGEIHNQTAAITSRPRALPAKNRRCSALLIEPGTRFSTYTRGSSALRQPCTAADSAYIGLRLAEAA
jgi:hypothetical protein